MSPKNKPTTNNTKKNFGLEVEKKDSGKKSMENDSIIGSDSDKNNFYIETVLEASKTADALLTAENQ